MLHVSHAAQVFSFAHEFVESWWYQLTPCCCRYASQSFCGKTGVLAFVNIHFIVSWMCASLLRSLHAAGCDMEQCGLVKQHLLGSSCAGLDPICPVGYLLLGSCWCGASSIAGGQAGEVQVLQSHYGCKRPPASVLPAGTDGDSAVSFIVKLCSVTQHMSCCFACILCHEHMPLLDLRYVWRCPLCCCNLCNVSQHMSCYFACTLCHALSILCSM